MAELNRAGEVGSLGHIDTNQGGFRQQIDALTNTVRQIAGNPDVGPSTSDPLSAPYVLYVDANIGSDTFVEGDYDITDNGDYESKMRRISLQRLECGYSIARPFRTINRAAIEAAIITSRSYLNLDPAPCGDLVSIVLQPGIHTLLNNESRDGEAVSAWTSTFEPTDAQLIGFNPASGGVVLPRGASLISLDLRKTIIRPNYVPARANEAADLSNRAACFKLTGGCFCYGFTFFDKLGSTTSHHLLDAFQYAGKADLDSFYTKVRTAVGESVFSGFVEDDYAVTRDKEYLIVGEVPIDPAPSVDTVQGASPYIYNISIRSELGMCGLLADGLKTVEGDIKNSFRSCVIAQFTGVSLQKDFNCWQIYNGSSWEKATSAAAVVACDPNNLRMDPKQRSVHIRARNKAVIQEVSVFAIGQGIHHLSESGSNVTITNSNSNFGGCASLAIGYNDEAAPSDEDWTPVSIRCALNPFDKSNSVQKIFLGTLDSGVADADTALELREDLFESTANPGQPDVLARDDYTLKEGDLVWISNPAGEDYYGELAANPWDTRSPAIVNIKAAVQTVGGDTPDPGVEPTLPAIAGLRIYVRRVKDTRTREERSYYLKLSGSSTNRIPVTDYVLRDKSDSFGESKLAAVAKGKLIASTNPAIKTVEIQLRNSITDNMNWSANKWYRVGDVIKEGNKFLTAVRVNYGKNNNNTRNAIDWDESYVHMASSFEPEGPLPNIAPIILFDGDTDKNEQTSNCGFSLNSAAVKAQYESATDYKGLKYYLDDAGYSGDIKPKNAQSREIPFTVADNLDEIEFRRPSNVRLYGQAFEWSGRYNYSKALPQYQQTLSENNRFTYYFTNEAGGKCYVSGFNEEGLQVTSRGLVNLETGNPVSIVDLGQDDILLQKDDPLPTARTFRAGILELADGVPNSPNEAARDALTAEINGDPTAVTPPYLRAYLDGESYVKSPGQNAVKVIHIIPQGVTALTGAASVPYGYPNAKADGTRYEQGVSDEAKTITDGLRIAERVFVSTGASVLLSVHGDIPTVERGPLQLQNGFSTVIVAGADGAVTPPNVNLKAQTTVYATARIPQYSSVEAMSAGVVWADLTLNINCNNQNLTFATFNGGFGVGGKDTSIRWSNAKDCCACTTSYGGTTAFQAYNADNPGASLSFTQEIVSASSQAPVFEMFGSGGGPSGVGNGLIGNGSNVAIDFRDASFGGTNKPKITFRYTYNDSDGSVPGTFNPVLSYLSLGQRGGCTIGGRLAPVIDLDFGNVYWDLSQWVSAKWTQQKNYHGKHFTVRPVSRDPEAEYNMTPATLATINVPGVCELTNGSCLDAGNTNNADAGAFTLYFQLDKYRNDNTRCMNALNGNGSFIYGFGTALYNEANTYEPS